MSMMVKWFDLHRRFRKVLIITGIVFGLAIIIDIIYPRDNPIQNYFIFVLPMIIFTAIFLVVLIVYLIIKSKDNKAKEERLTWMSNQLELSDGNEKLEELRLSMLNFSHDFREQKCSICLLDLDVNSQVVQCTKCEKLFHKNHFINWLSENEVCPNCKNLILPFD